MYGVLYAQNLMSNSLLPIEEFEQFEPIRRIQDEESGEWYFAVVDVVDVLAQPKNAGEYWRTIKNRDDSNILRTICLLYTSPSPRDS